MGAWSRIAGARVPRLARAARRIAAGSTSAAATARSPSSSPSAARRRASTASTRRRASSPMRARAPRRQLARFHRGDAMALPFDDGGVRHRRSSALVIHFIPDPAKGVAEMARVAAPGGTVAAYMWDMPGGGFPLDAHAAGDARAGRRALPRPPSDDVVPRRRDARPLARTPGSSRRRGSARSPCAEFDDFDDWWTTSLQGASIASALAVDGAGDVERLRSRMRVRMPADARRQDHRCSARANAIRGRVPTAERRRASMHPALRLTLAVVAGAVVALRAVGLIESVGQPRLSDAGRPGLVKPEQVREYMDRPAGRRARVRARRDGSSRPSSAASSPRGSRARAPRSPPRSSARWCSPRRSRTSC